MDPSLWWATLWQFALVFVLVSAVATALLGGVLASSGRLPLWVGLVVGAVFSVVGLAVLAVIAVVRAVRHRMSRRAVSADLPADHPPASRIDSPVAAPAVVSGRRRRRLSAAAAAVLCLGAVSTLFGVWFTFDSTIVPPFRMSPWGTGADVAVLVSVALFGLAVVLVWFRPSRVASSVVTVVGTTWLFVAASALLLSGPVTALLADVGNLSYSVGDALEAVGADTSASTIELPPGVDLSALGITGSSIELGAVDLAAPIPAATLELGPAWFIVLAVGAAGVVWSAAELQSAHARARRSRSADASKPRGG
jgi:hypothetical protein